jgi:hypothetical protein
MFELVSNRPEIAPVAFRFLDSLREDGHVNMFGAAPILADAFMLSKQEARVVLEAWMRSKQEAK